MGVDKRVNRLFCFGLGYSALALARRLSAQDWSVSGTSRTDEGVQQLAQQGYEACRFDGSANVDPEAFSNATHILISIPPDKSGDLVVKRHTLDLAQRSAAARWVAYLSTTGVYGDRGGDWVDEASTLDSETERGKLRIEAEASWIALHRTAGLPVHIFRLAGIYGPGRNQLCAIREGKAHRIIKPGQVFNRIHVEDIAGILEASMDKPNPGAIYNVCDDEPAPPQEVVSYAAMLLGCEPPPEIPFAKAKLSPLAKSFFSACQRVSNERIKKELGYRLRYPSYREGLRDLLIRP